MPSLKHVVIIAGEESGDIHAAALVTELKERQPTLKITGMGGPHLLRVGVPLVSNLAEYGVAGVSDVFRYFPRIRRAFLDLVEHLKSQKPDLLILVDYPGFNLRLATAAKKLNIKVLYYISPQIWAWKASRIHRIKASVDHMAVIFPFEKKIYEKAGVPVSFVGHPLVHALNHRLKIKPTRATFNLPENKRLLALLPGSRHHELERHMPILIDSAQQLLERYPNLHVVVPVAECMPIEKVATYFKHTSIPHTLLKGKAIEAAYLSDAVVVSSGTASLECALLEKPMCIIYQSTWLTSILASKLIKVNYLGLCNVLQERMIVPELLYYDCNAPAIVKLISTYLDAPTQTKPASLTELKISLSEEKADCKLVDLVLQAL